MIQFEKEVLAYLNIPSIPKKEHDGKTAFAKGVAVIETIYGEDAYAVASFSPEDGEETPKIVKVFGQEPFRAVKNVFVVPSYMASAEDVDDMDLDEQSKKNAKEILKEAADIENEGVETDNAIDNLPEWIFDEIHSKKEAVAWLKNFQSRNKQRGSIPKTDENIKLRLYSIYCELQNKTK
jgi:hypothetical protein